MRFVSVSDWLRNGTLRITTSAVLDRLGVLEPGELAVGDAAPPPAPRPPARARGRGSRSRSARRPARAAARARIRARRSRRRCRLLLARRGSLCAAASTVLRRMGSALEEGIEATAEFAVDGRLLTDVGGTLGFRSSRRPAMIAMMERTAAMLVYPLTRRRARRPSASRSASSMSASPRKGSLHRTRPARRDRRRPQAALHGRGRGRRRPHDRRRDARAASHLHARRVGLPFAAGLAAARTCRWRARRSAAVRAAPASHAVLRDSASLAQKAQDRLEGRARTRSRRRHSSRTPVAVPADRAASHGSVSGVLCSPGSPRSRLVYSRHRRGRGPGQAIAATITRDRATG